ncbi:MAG: ScyD/ScyE family protein [Dermatophilaceae bacterium]
MRQHLRASRLVGAGVLTLLVGISGSGAAIAATGPVVVASGLNSPRQLAFTPGGTLYVAEAGAAGPEGNCQEHPELGHVCFGLTGSVARVGLDGKVERVVTDLPSAGSATDVIGPSDIAFTGNHQFALTIGLGGSPEYRAGYGADAALLGTVVTGDLRANKGAGTVTKVFDVAGYEAAANPDGTDVDSNSVGITRSGNGWVVADAGGNDVVSTRGGGSTVGVLPPVPTTRPGGGLPPGFPADAVPTDVVQGPDGAWYVSQLVGFPFEKGSSSIWRIVPGQTPQRWATGLTNVTSLAFADDGSLYAVQIASDGLLSGPVGALVKVTPGASTHAIVAGGLFAPYGVAIRGSAAYVTTGSVAVGNGQVVKIAL